jgi:outer membrane protein
MSSKLMGLVLACACLAGTGTAAHAQDASGNPHWWARVGVAHIDFHPDVQVSVGGSPFGPVADARVSNNTTLSLEAGYEFLPRWSASVLFGYPPETTLSSASFGGDLGHVRYGTAVFSVQYRFGQGAWRPYVGGGVGYSMIFSSKDAGLKDLDVDNAWAPAAVIGLEYAFTPKLGAWFDVRKLWHKTHATAAGGVRADLRLDPVIFSAGLSFRFQ